MHKSLRFIIAIEASYNVYDQAGIFGRKLRCSSETLYVYSVVNENLNRETYMQK